MFTEVKLKDGQGTHYGLGVEVSDLDGHREIEHSGEVTGFVAENESSSTTASPSPFSPTTWQAARRSPASPPPPSREPSCARRGAGLAIYRALQKGQIDRSLLAPNLEPTSTPSLADFKYSLGPLGEPLTFRQTGEQLRGGMTMRAFRIVYPTRRLRLSTYTYPDGKLEQYLVEPAE